MGWGGGGWGGTAHWASTATVFHCKDNLELISTTVTSSPSLCKRDANEKRLECKKGRPEGWVERGGVRSPCSDWMRLVSLAERNDGCLSLSLSLSLSACLSVLRRHYTAMRYRNAALSHTITRNSYTATPLFISRRRDARVLRFCGCHRPIARTHTHTHTQKII